MKSKISIALVLSVLGYGLQAQSPDGGMIITGGAKVVVNNAYLVVDGGTKGDIAVTGTSGIDLDGGATLQVDGDVINNGTGNMFEDVDGTGGTLELIGSESGLNIGGTGTINVDNLTFNRSGSPTYTMTNDVTIENTLTLNTDGIVSTGSNNLIMTSTDAADLVGTFSNTRFINTNNGGFRRGVTDAGTYVLPIGNGTATTNYHRAEVISSGLATAGTSYLTSSFETVAASGNEDESNFNDTYDGTTVDKIAETSGGSGNYVQWIITPDVQPGGTNNYDVRLYVENTEVEGGSYDNKFVVAKRSEASTNASDWDCQDGSVTIPTGGAAGRVASGGAGYAEMQDLESFSKFTIALGINPLPIELVNFGGNCLDGALQFYWQTATEIDNQYFSLQQSQDGIEWTEIAQIPGAGTTSEMQFYEYVVEEVSEDAAYRLKQVDIDGAHSHSEIVEVASCEEIGSEVVEAYHNGLDQIKIISSVDDATNFAIDLYDVSGKRVSNTHFFTASPGVDQFELSTASMASGFYLVDIKGQTSNHTYKLFVR